MEDEPSQAATEIRKALLPNPTISWARGIGGAIVGGLLGYLLFKWLLTMGFYAGMVPGGFIGAGFGMAAGRKMGWTAAILCGLAGLMFGSWADAATNDPAQNLLEYFGQYHLVPDMNKILIALGALASGWFARGN